VDSRVPIKLADEGIGFLDRSTIFRQRQLNFSV